MTCSDCREALPFVDGRCRACDHAKVVREALAEPRRKYPRRKPLSERKWPPSPLRRYRKYGHVIQPPKEAK
jgi:hypothetical protein